VPTVNFSNILLLLRNFFICHGSQATGQGVMFTTAAIAFKEDGVCAQRQS
jgi:hypothetical protein